MNDILNPTLIAQLLNFIIIASIIILFLLWVFRHMTEEIVKIRNIYRK